jgi:hypothetical protein
MNGNMFTRYPKESLLEGKQTPTRVSDLLKNPITEGKIKQLSSQRVGHDSGPSWVTWLRRFVMSSGMGKCQFRHVLLHQEE